MSIGNSNGLCHRPRASAPCPAARRGWEYRLDAMSAAGTRAWTRCVLLSAIPHTPGSSRAWRVLRASR